MSQQFSPTSLPEILPASATKITSCLQLDANRDKVECVNSAVSGVLYFLTAPSIVLGKLLRTLWGSKMFGPKKEEEVVSWTEITGLGASCGIILPTYYHRY